MSRWNNGGPLEEREAPHLGCDLSGHLCPSYSAHATREAGAVAALAEERKVAKYVNLTSKHLFFPIAVETMGVLGPNTYQGAPQGPRSPGDQDNRELGGSYHLPHPTAVSGSAAGQLCLSDGHHRPDRFWPFLLTKLSPTQNAVDLIKITLEFIFIRTTLHRIYIYTYNIRIYILIIMYIYIY